MKEKDKEQKDFLDKEELIDFGKFIMILDPELEKLGDAAVSIAASYNNIDKYKEKDKKDLKKERNFNEWSMKDKKYLKTYLFYVIIINEIYLR